MTSITKVQPDDLPVLAAVGRTTLLQSHGHSAPADVMQAYVDDKFSEDSLRTELADNSAQFYLIRFNGVPAGYSKILFRRPIDAVPDTSITKLERLYLLEEFHDKKLGHELLQFNIDLSKRAGDGGMWLYVWKENHRAIRFYERAGFVIVGDGFFPLAGGHANPNWQMYLSY